MVSSLAAYITSPSEEVLSLKLLQICRVCQELYSREKNTEIGQELRKLLAFENSKKNQFFFFFFLSFLIRVAVEARSRLSAAFGCGRLRSSAFGS